MRKHSLISTGLGVGLLAASLGAAAQPATWTFDYSMMFFTPTATGTKYVAFVPTLSRAAAGSSGVLMLELFQPAGSGANSWAFAIAGSVGTGSGGAGGTHDYGALVAGTAASAVTAGVGLTTPNFAAAFGDTIAMAMSFTQTAAGASSQLCDVTFTANIGTGGLLNITSAKVQPQSWATYTASAAAGYTFTTNSTGGTATFASSIFTNASASVASYSYTASGADALVKFNRCVTAYSNRVNSTGTLVGTGLIRVW